MPAELMPAELMPAELLPAELLPAELLPAVLLPAVLFGQWFCRSINKWAQRESLEDENLTPVFISFL
jgi:hypothetical protein